MAFKWIRYKPTKKMRRGEKITIGGVILSTKHIPTPMAKYVSCTSRFLKTVELSRVWWHPKAYALLIYT